MNCEEMNAMLAEAERTISAADDVSGRIARLLIGRLRKVNSGYTLSLLKRELKDFDSRNGVWS